MMNKPWLSRYPQGVDPELAEIGYRSLADLLDHAFQTFAERDALHFMGASFTYRRFGELARDFAAYLQTLGLKKGDRIALMMPNVPQYPVAIAGATMAGLDHRQRQPALYARRTRPSAAGFRRQSHRRSGEHGRHTGGMPSEDAASSMSW